MKYENVKHLKPEDFRRLTGIKRATFDKMIEILTEEDEKKRRRGGKPHILCIQNRLLMALEYLREYRTYFHIANDYGVSESTCFRNTRWIEDTLIKHPDFSLPGKKELLRSDISIEAVLIDATETPIERPKKTNNTSILAKRNAIH